MSDQIISEIWSRRVMWSRAAGKLNRAITRARVLSLALSAGGAIFAALAATLAVDWATVRALSAGFSAVCLAASTFVAAEFVSNSYVRRWTRARTISEAIKSEVFAFRAAAAPYDAPDAASLLQRKVRALESSGHALASLRSMVVEAVEEPPPALSRDGYLEMRIRAQIDAYYRPKARLYMRRSSLLRWAQASLNLLAAVVGGIAAFLSRQGAGSVTLAAWVAVITTLATSLSAHQAAARYDFLAMSFHATAARLEALLDEWRIDGSAEPAAWSAFVQDCEAAILTENGGWMSKWEDKSLSL